MSKTSKFFNDLEKTLQHCRYKLVKHCNWAPFGGSIEPVPLAEIGGGPGKCYIKNIHHFSSTKSTNLTKVVAQYLKWLIEE